MESRRYELLGSIEIVDQELGGDVFCVGHALLPDGRVLTCGSNPRRRVDEPRIELYRPPYLFAGPRPTIESVPERVVSDESFDVETPDAREVDEVVLVRPSSTTHCLNTDQRLVELVVERKDGGTLTVRLPANPNLLPPGYYLLFALREGVPSVAPFVQMSGGG